MAQYDRILTAANKAFEEWAAAKDKPRRYLGASAIGGECARQLWYKFRGATGAPISARGLGAIYDGHNGEVTIVERLQRVEGLTLHPTDDKGNQFAVVDLDGHFRGHMDGAMQVDGEWSVFEAKVCNETKFKKLLKLRDADEDNALKSWDEVYYAQAQVYMHLTGLRQHYTVVATPGVRDWTSVWTKYNKDAAEGLLEKARYIIEATEPPDRVRNDPTYYICKWCDFSDICHGDKIPEASCKTCIHSRPVEDAKWECTRHRKSDVDLEKCGDHVILPELVSFARKVSYDSDRNVTKYIMPNGVSFEQGTRPKGGAVYTGDELVNTDPTLIGDSTVELLRDEFDASVVPSPDPDTWPFKEFEPSEEVKNIDWSIGDKEIPF